MTSEVGIEVNPLDTVKALTVPPLVPGLDIVFVSILAFSDQYTSTELFESSTKFAAAVEEVTVGIKSPFK